MDAQAMTHFELTGYETIGILLSAGAWLMAGALIGSFYFMTLHWNVRMFMTEQSLLLPLGVQFVRFALIAAVLAAITRFSGALPLLVTTAGILGARTAILRWGVRS
jgi:F1F0 ATPase subunit 2